VIVCTDPRGAFGLGVRGQGPELRLAGAADRLLDLAGELEGYLANGESGDLACDDTAAFQLRRHELLSDQTDRIRELQQPV